MMNDSKVVLITGCSSGVGRGLCKEMSKRGYTVIATARNANKLLNVESDMKLNLDVTDETSINNAVNSILSKHGRIDILINNAGYSVRGAIEELDVEATKRMFDVNVYGTIRMIKAVAPIMRAQGSGGIVNIGSISGKMTNLLNGSYCATKHSVEAISDAARYELRNFGIKVMLLEPGAMETEFFNTLSVNTDYRVNNSESPYRKMYEDDIKYRNKQKRTAVEKSVYDMCSIIEKKKWKARYTISVPFIFKLLIKLPDSLEEKLIIKFSK